MVVFAKWRPASLYEIKSATTPFLDFSYNEAFCLRMDLVCSIAIVVAHAYLPLQIGVAFEAGSPSACLCQYAHATTLHAEKCIAGWFTIVYDGTRHGNVFCIGDGCCK